MLLVVLAVVIILGSSLLLLTAFYFWCTIKRRKRTPGSYFLAVGFLLTGAGAYCGYKTFTGNIGSNWGLYTELFLLIAIIEVTTGVAFTGILEILRNQLWLRRRTGSLLRSAAQFIDTPADNQP